MTLRQRTGLVWLVICTAQMHDSKHMTTTIVAGVLMLIGGLMVVMEP